MKKSNLFYEFVEISIYTLIFFAIFFALILIMYGGLFGYI